MKKIRKETILSKDLTSRALWVLHQGVVLMVATRLATFSTAPSLVAAATIDIQANSPVVLATNEQLSIARFLGATNQYRKTYGRADLVSSDILSRAANEKLRDMARNKYWGHVGPQRQEAWDFMRTSGYEYKYAGENLARGFRTAEGVTSAWMASPTHRDNLLDERYTDVGYAAGYVRVADGSLQLLTVQLFGSR